MRLTRTALIACAGSAALALTACGGGTEEAEPAASSSAPAEEAPEFEEGTTMATIAEEGAIQIGTKFDQPGFGLTDLGGDPEGFDVEIATYIAAQLGLDAEVSGVHCAVRAPGAAPVVENDGEVPREPLVRPAQCGHAPLGDDVAQRGQPDHHRSPAEHLVGDGDAVARSGVPQLRFPGHLTSIGHGRQRRG